MAVVNLLCKGNAVRMSLNRLFDKAFEDTSKGGLILVTIPDISIGNADLAIGYICQRLKSVNDDGSTGGSTKEQEERERATYARMVFPAPAKRDVSNGTSKHCER